VFARVGSDGTEAWSLPDHLGSVRGLMNNSGTLIDTISFDPWGKVTNESSPANGDRFKFALGQWDANLGQYHLGARWEDPTNGHWTSLDPLGFGAGDTNLYRYVFNSPTGGIDPSGLRDLFLDNPEYARLGMEIANEGSDDVQLWPLANPDFAEFGKRMADYNAAQAKAGGFVGNNNVGMKWYDWVPVVNMVVWVDNKLALQAQENIGADLEAQRQAMVKREADQMGIDFWTMQKGGPIWAIGKGQTIGNPNSQVEWREGMGVAQDLFKIWAAFHQTAPLLAAGAFIPPGGGVSFKALNEVERRALINCRDEALQLAKSAAVSGDKGLAQYRWQIYEQLSDVINGTGTVHPDFVKAVIGYGR
jgi:RHS repeat-associated protein